MAEHLIKKLCVYAQGRKYTKEYFQLNNSTFKRIYVPLIMKRLQEQ